MKTFKMRYTVYKALTAMLCVVSYVGTASGDVAASEQRNGPRSQMDKTAPGMERIPEELGRLCIIRTLEAKDLESLEAPSKAYRLQDGREYELSHWEIKEIPGHMESRRMEKQIVYAGVEGAEGLPKSIAVAEEATDIPAEGELSICRTRVLKEEWQEGFCVPVTFHSYGADGYEVGNMVISGENALGYEDELRRELLSMIGLSAKEYRIHTIEWTGEPYMDDTGQMCRQALAKGEKLLKDYEITYDGEVNWMRPVFYELSMVYQEAVQPRVWSETDLEPAPAPAPEPEPEKGPLWYWMHSGFVITVAAGLIGIIVGVVLLFISRRRLRRQKKSGRYLPEIKG